MSATGASTSKKPAQTTAKAKAKAKTEGKAKAGGKGKGKKAASAGGPSVAAHPRAAAAVRRTKGFAGLAGFALAALLSHRAGLTAAGVIERALLAGIGGYLLGWACAVTVWRHIVLAELRAVQDRLAERTGRPMISLAAPEAPAADAAPPAES